MADRAESAEEPTQPASGVVTRVLTNGLYEIELDGGLIVVAHLAGTARLHLIRVITGDRVLIEPSSFDAGKGRIVGKADGRKGRLR